ncbi:ABC transporter ATP-binding protein [Plasticicumulans acidivorans]|uniref:Putative ABC transport system ATP-binding protein n=1 Tax=Plasticicumulans acidivorans TaxID=886464 RepID=A0A317MU23_9GAMM|nr:ABC transporter ATP-binding protein [Plasticicumulans acidivorans]PWV60562.1 putative ABC transport system ATP-binding protein [Plasticicumulans acidivorans]
MIAVDAVQVVFNAGTPLQNEVLRGLSLDIAEGQFVTVIGSNGAGKSTLLNVLAGEVQPSRGRVRIGGRDVTGQAPHQRAALVGRVFQDPLAGTCGELTIEENLALAAARGTRRGFGRALDTARRTRFREALAALGLGLEHRLHDRIGLLSGGQRQAVSLLMATLQPLQILLLDEHTAALDPQTAALVLRLSCELIAEHRLTALMVTHSMRQALAVGDRTVMLHRGDVVFDVAGVERARLDVPDLLALFERARGETLDQDDLLLA